MPIQIHLQDGNIITAEVEAYNSAELAAKLNDPKLLMIQVGSAIINKNVVKLIIPVQTA